MAVGARSELNGGDGDDLLVAGGLGAQAFAQDGAKIEAILEAGSHDLGPKAARMEDPADWTEEKIRAAAAKIDSDKGPEGDFDD